MHEGSLRAPRAFLGKAAPQLDVLLPTEMLRKADSRSPFSFPRLKVVPPCQGTHLSSPCPIQEAGPPGVLGNPEEGFGECDLVLGFASNRGTGEEVGQEGHPCVSHCQ